MPVRPQGGQELVSGSGEGQGDLGMTVSQIALGEDRMDECTRTGPAATFMKCSMSEDPEICNRILSSKPLLVDRSTRIIREQETSLVLELGGPADVLMKQSDRSPGAKRGRSLAARLRGAILPAASSAG